MSGVLEPSQPTKVPDILDLMTVEDLHTTPLYAMTEKGERLTGMDAKWEADQYADPRATSVPDGKDVEAADYEDHAANRKFIEGRAHVTRRVAYAGFIANSVTQIAGAKGKKEYEIAVQKKVKEVPADIELTMIGSQDSAADNGTDGSITRGLEKWIQSSAQADLPVDALYRTPAGSIKNETTAADHTEENLIDIMQSVWTETRKKVSFFCPTAAAQKKVINDWTIKYTPTGTEVPLRRFNGDQDARKMVLAVDIYEGDFGTCQFYPHSLMRYDTNAQKATVMLLDMSMIKMRPHTAPHHEPLPNMGGGPRGKVEAIWALAVLNPRYLGKLTVD